MCNQGSAAAGVIESISVLAELASIWGYGFFPSFVDQNFHVADYFGPKYVQLFEQCGVVSMFNPPLRIIS